MRPAPRAIEPRSPCWVGMGNGDECRPIKRQSLGDHRSAEGWAETARRGNARLLDHFRRSRPQCATAAQRRFATLSRSRRKLAPGPLVRSAEGSVSAKRGLEPLVRAAPLSARPRRRRVRVDSIARNRFAQRRGLKRPLLDKRLKRRKCDVPPIDLKEPAQLHTRVASTEAVGSQRHEAHLYVSGDEHRVGADIVARRHDRRAPGEESRDMACSPRRVGTQPVPPLDFGRLARELAEARRAEDVAADPPIRGKHLGGGDRLAQNRSRTEQPDARSRKIRARAADPIEARHDVGFDAFGHRRLRVGLVHDGDVVELVDLGFDHAAHAVVDDDREFVGVGGVVGAAVRRQGRHRVTGAVLMLQPLPREGRAARRGAQQEPACPLVGRGPDQVADPLKAEHRIVDIERQHREVVDAVGGRRRRP